MSPSNPEHPGWIIRDRLDELDRSQAWLSHEAQVSEKHISQIMTGESGYSAEMAIRLAGALGISAQELMYALVDWQIARIQAALSETG